MVQWVLSVWCQFTVSLEWLQVKEARIVVLLGAGKGLFYQAGLSFLLSFCCFAMDLNNFISHQWDGYLIQHFSSFAVGIFSIYIQYFGDEKHPFWGICYL